MKAPNKCPMCGEKKKWIMVDKTKHGNTTGAVVGAIAGSLVSIPGALAGGLIGNALGKGKKTGEFHCGNCGFAHIYDL